MIHLTDEQRQAMQQTGDNAAVPVYDSQSERTYYLLPGPLFDRVRGHLELPSAEEPGGIAPGIQRSKEAFLRDLPVLMKSWWYRYKWVGYHGNERIAIHRQKIKVILEMKRRGIPSDQYHVDIIRHHEPEPEEIEPSSAGLPD